MVGEELKNPGRDMPRSIVFGMLTVIFIYVTANVACLCILPADGESLSPEDLREHGVEFLFVFKWSEILNVDLR
jgi:amino acid transporter